MNVDIDVVEMFVSVNGEGDEIGRRTAFIRVFGCSANCPDCDTPYAKGNKTDEVKSIQPQDIIDFVRANKLRHVTITGGEPFEHRSMHDILGFLIQHGINVTVETNGMVKPGGLDPRVHVVVSPKPWMLVDKNRDSYFYWSTWGATFKFAGSPADVERIRKWYKIFRLQKAYIQPWIPPEVKSRNSYRKHYLELLDEVNKRFKDGEDIRITPQWHKLVYGFSSRGV